MSSSNLHSNCSLELSVESLERRAMLAGNVTVDFNNGGDLILRGDNDDNVIRVVGNHELENETGVLISGESGTQLTNLSDLGIKLRSSDGIDRYFFADQPIRDLRAEMRDGDDVVRVDHVTADDDINIRTGSGEDYVWLNRTEVADTVSLNMGSGADNVSIEVLDVGNDLRIEGGNGQYNDQLALEEINVQDDVRVNLGAGSDFTPELDSVLIYGIVRGDLSIRAGNAASEVNLPDLTVHGRTSIDTGGGADSILINRSTLIGRLKVSTGSGNDDFTTGLSQYRDDVRISLGSDDDELYVTGPIGASRFFADARIDGGRGYDAIIQSNSPDLSTEDFRGFEVFPI